MVTTRRQYWWAGVGPQGNKFEQVSSDDVSYREGPQVWCLGEGEGDKSPGLMSGGGGTLPYDYVTYDACDVPYPPPSPSPCGQTDAYESVI